MPALSNSHSIREYVVLATLNSDAAGKADFLAMADDSRRVRNAVRLGYDLRAPSFGHSPAQRHGSRPVPVPKVPSGSTVLDVGCGTGAATQPLVAQETAGLVVGLDLSAGMLRRARQMFLGNPTVHLVQADAERLPFHSSSFNTIVSHRSLSHLPDPCGAFQELARVLGPGGVVDITLIGDRALGRPIERLFRMVLREILGPLAQPLIDLYRPPTISAVDVAAYSAGLLVNQLTAVTTHNWGEPHRLVDRLLVATTYIQAQLDRDDANRVATRLHARATNACGPRGLMDWSYEIHYVGRKGTE